MDTYMTTDELSDLLRTPVETLRHWRQVGKGPRSFKPGKRVLYARSDVEEFLHASRAQPDDVAMVSQ